MAQAKKRKKFFDVEIPIINKKTDLIAYNIEELNGKFIIYDLSRLLRGKNTLIQLKIKVDNSKATSTPKKMWLLPQFLKRMVRKGTNCVEDSFSITCKNAQVKIKPFLVTRKKVSRAVRKALRNKAKELLIENMKNENIEEIFDALLKNKTQRTLSLTLKKIYPLSFCDIRVIEVEKFLEKEK